MLGGHSDSSAGPGVEVCKEPCTEGEWGECDFISTIAGAMVECGQEHSKRSPPGSRLEWVLVHP